MLSLFGFDALEGPVEAVAGEPYLHNHVVVMVGLPQQLYLQLDANFGTSNTRASQGFSIQTQETGFSEYRHFAGVLIPRNEYIAYGDEESYRTVVLDSRIQDRITLIASQRGWKKFNSIGFTHPAMSVSSSQEMFNKANLISSLKSYFNDRKTSLLLAQKLARERVEANPNSSSTLANLAEILSNLAYTEPSSIQKLELALEANQYFQKAHAINPLNAVINKWYGEFLYETLAAFEDNFWLHRKIYQRSQFHLNRFFSLSKSVGHQAYLGSTENASAIMRGLQKELSLFRLPFQWIGYHLFELPFKKKSDVLLTPVVKNDQANQGTVIEQNLNDHYKPLPTQAVVTRAESQENDISPTRRFIVNQLDPYDICYLISSIDRAFTSKVYASDMLRDDLFSGKINRSSCVAKLARLSLMFAMLPAGIGLRFYIRDNYQEIKNQITNGVNVVHTGALSLVYFIEDWLNIVLIEPRYSSNTSALYCNPLTNDIYVLSNNKRVEVGACGKNNGWECQNNRCAPPQTTRENVINESPQDYLIEVENGADLERFEKIVSRLRKKKILLRSNRAWSLEALEQIDRICSSVPVYMCQNVLFENTVEGDEFKASGSAKVKELPVIKIRIAKDSVLVHELMHIAVVSKGFPLKELSLTDGFIWNFKMDEQDNLISIKKMNTYLIQEFIKTGWTYDEATDRWWPKKDDSIYHFKTYNSDQFKERYILQEIDSEILPHGYYMEFYGIQAGPSEHFAVLGDLYWKDSSQLLSDRPLFEFYRDKIFDGRVFYNGVCGYYETERVPTQDMQNEYEGETSYMLRHTFVPGGEVCEN
jgi:hypothetical protein